MNDMELIKQVARDLNVTLDEAADLVLGKAIQRQNGMPYNPAAPDAVEEAMDPEKANEAKMQQMLLDQLNKSGIMQGPEPYPGSPGMMDTGPGPAMPPSNLPTSNEAPGMVDPRMMPQGGVPPMMGGQGGRGLGGGRINQLMQQMQPQGYNQTTTTPVKSADPITNSATQLIQELMAKRGGGGQPAQQQPMP